MCGIGGIIITDRRKHFDKQTQLNSIALLHELQDRGSEAWGVYLRNLKNNHNLNCGIQDDSLDGEIFKTAGSVSDFFNNSDSRVDLNKAQIMLMHTRQSTKGNPEENENNHPFATKDFVLAHNGTISNHDTLRKKYNIDSKIECDSYVIVALIQHFYESNGGDIPKAIKSASEELSGGFACWLYHKESRDIYLFRHTNPIHYISKNGRLYFASTSRHLTEILDDVYARDVEAIDADTIYKVDKDKLIELDTFSASGYTGYNQGLNSYNTSSYNSQSSKHLDIETVDSSLVYLYELFEKYEDSSNIKTIIALSKSEVILLVSPNELVSKLNENGFDKYKEVDKLYNSNYNKYRVSPPEKINDLVKNLKGESTPESKSGKVDMSKFENKSKEELKDFFFTNVFMETFEILDLGIDYNEKKETITIGTEHGKKPEKYIKDLFKSLGIQLSSKTNSITLKLSEYHLKKMIELYLIVEGDLNDK